MGRKRKLIKIIWGVIFIFLLILPVEAKEGGVELVVGVRQVPPFAMQDQEGNWRGITVELWELIAEELELLYRYQPVSLEGMLEGVQDRTIDVAAAALSITSQRERVMDFSHPFYHAGLSIAVASRPVPSWLSVARRLISWEFIKVLGVLALILLIFGFLMWLFERRRNRAQFGGHPTEGIGSGFWWSAVTMTTVGYGDKAPLTLGGRLVALVWMFSSIVIVSSITAAITSTLTVASLDVGIQGPKDLPQVKAGTIRKTTSVNYFLERGMHPQLYETLDEALQALASGEIEALVYDAPILSYLINKRYPGKLTVIPRTFEEQQYGIALAFESPLRQDINHILLELIESGEFRRIKQRYLGQEVY